MLNYVYLWCLTRVPEEQREEWLAMLNESTDGEQAAPFDEEQEEESFMAAFAAIHGGS